MLRLYCRPLIGIPKWYSTVIPSTVLRSLAAKETALNSADLEAAKGELLHPSRHHYDVSLPLAVLKRVFQEMSDPVRPSWMPIALNTALHTWKRVAKRNPLDVPPPDAIVDDILLKAAVSCGEVGSANSNANSWFGAVLEVLIHQAPQTEGPRLAEAFAQKHIREPDSYVYSLVLEAWASSGLDEAREKIEAIDAKMQRANIPHTRKSCMALLRFWGAEKHHNLERIDAAWRDFSRLSIEVDAGLWAALAVGLARSNGRLDEARMIVLNKLLDQKLVPPAEIHHMSIKTIEVVTELIRSYRRCILEDKKTTKTLLNHTRELMHELASRKLDRDGKIFRLDCCLAILTASLRNANFSLDGAVLRSASVP